MLLMMIYKFLRKVLLQGLCCAYNILCTLWFHFWYGAMDNLPPGNMGLPVIGETVSFLRKSESGEFFTDRYSKFGPIFCTHFLGMNNIHVRSVDDVKTILMGEHQLVAVHWPPAMRRLLGRGSLSNTLAPQHGHLRRLIRPHLNADASQRYKPVMVDCIQGEISQWLQAGCIDLYDAAKKLTMKCACAVLIGPNGLEDGLVTNLVNDFITFGEGFFQIPLAIPGSKFYMAVKAKERILLVVTRLVQQNKTSTSVLNHMFGTESPYSDEQNDLMVELLFGAQETAACAVTCAMTLLYQHPQAFDTLRHELDTLQNNNVYDDVLLKSGVKLDGNPELLDWLYGCDVRKLEYLDGVVKETLRLFPPIGGGFRKVLKTFTLGEYTVPEGWTITYSIHDMHGDSNMSGADQFLPSRWLHMTQPPQGFLPFSAGPRCCVGRDYGRLFVPLTIAIVASRCHWHLRTERPTFTRVPIVRPQHPLLVDIHER